MKPSISLIAWIVICYCPLLMAELPVTDGLVMHLDASSISGVSDGNPINVWTDQSGAGNNATQSTSGVQPLYIAGEAAFSGFPVVRFDGSNDYMILLSTTLTDTIRGQD